MLESVFGSKTRVSLFTLFCLNPGKKYYIREISRIINTTYGVVSAELQNLETFGLLKSKVDGSQKYYWIDEQFFLYEDFQKLVLKTEGVIKTLKDELSILQNIDFLFVYGSFASGKANAQSDIDLFIVGNLNYEDLIEAIGKNEKKLERPINFTIYKKEELITRIQNQDSFVLNVINSPKIPLIGNENEFNSLGTTRTDKKDNTQS
jgi:predicted nucleotidyltransferase